MAKVVPDAESYGTLAEFHDEAHLLTAVKAARTAEYEVIEAYTPMPCEEIVHALGYKTKLPYIILCGGLVGMMFGLGIQYWTSVIDYPLNVGGRPYNSWPAFVIVAFECTILFAAFTAVLGMFALNGLPRPHHPVFNIEAFGLASRNRFFLLVLSRDPKYVEAEVRALLEGVDPIEIWDVPP